MNDYQKELWKKRQEYELAHKDNSKLPVKPKKKKKKVKSNTDNYVTGKVKQTTNKATKNAKNKAHMQDLVNTSKTKQATKKATKDAKRNAHTNDYSNITDSTKNGKKKKSKLKHSDVYLAHSGSLKYKDRLELQTDPDGNYTSGTLYRDYYDSEDDEYIDAKIIRELNSTKGG